MTRLDIFNTRLSTYALRQFVVFLRSCCVVLYLLNPSRTSPYIYRRPHWPFSIVAAWGCDTVAPPLADNSLTAYSSSPSSSLSSIAVILMVPCCTVGVNVIYPDIWTRSVRAGVSYSSCTSLQDKVTKMVKSIYGNQQRQKYCNDIQI